MQIEMRYMHLASLLGLLRLIAHVIAINPGQLGIRLNPQLGRKEKFVFNAIAMFEDDILATW